MSLMGLMVKAMANAQSGGRIQDLDEQEAEDNG